MRFLAPLFLASALANASPAAEGEHVCDIYPECRGLTSGEIALAQTIFGDTIDYQSVSIIKGRYLGIFPIGDQYTGMAPDGNIYAVSPDVQSDDYSSEPVSVKGFFIHEMSHVWQTAQGVNVIATGFGLHMTKGTASYQYDVHQETVFGAQSIEQQAKIVENYFLWEQYLLRTEGQGQESLAVSRAAACETYLLHHAAAVQALPLPPALKACLK